MKRKLFSSLIISVSIISLASVGICASAAPQYGGVLQIVAPSGPQVLSYVPMMGPQDHSAIFPAGERLVDTNIERHVAGGVEPVLAEKVVEDSNNLTITWYIRKGVKFHDGSDLNAEVVRWNFQQVLNAKALPYAKYLKSMKVVDEYTLLFELTAYNNQLMATWGWWVLITSKVAWDQASGGDLKKGKDWARTHIVGTGPFKLKEWKRDVHMMWEKNPNYWKKGRPYLDGIQVRFIPDPVTASSMMQAKEADVWDAPPRDQQELTRMGFTRQGSWPALGYCIIPNTANPDSKWQNKKLREAVEYSLHKDAIAKALGFGFYKGLKSLPMEGEWGYDPNYNPRPYNPEKAKKLLAEAGYPKGLKVKLMVFFTPDNTDAGTAIKQFMDDAGFDVDLDVADPGRFFGTIYNNMPGPDHDLCFWLTGKDTNYLQTYMRWFSTEPFTDLSFLGHTPEQAEMDAKAQSLTDLKAQEEITSTLMRRLTDEALIIPVYEASMAAMQQTWVHSTRYEQGFVRWQTEEVWMEKH